MMRALEIPDWIPDGFLDIRDFPCLKSGSSKSILLVSKRIKRVLRPIKPHFKNISFQWSTNLGVSCFLQLMLTRDRRAKNDLRDWSVVYSLAQELRCANLQPSSWCHEPDSWPINQLTLKLLGHSQKYFLISKLWSGCKGSFAWTPQPFSMGSHCENSYAPPISTCGYFVRMKRRKLYV